MAINEGLADSVRELLEDVEHVTEKKMFSGIAFMVDEKLCIAVRGNNIMLRIDPALQDDLVETDGCAAMIMRGKALHGYVTVDEALIDTKNRLSYWVNLALAYNPIAKASKKKPIGKKK